MASKRNPPAPAPTTPTTTPVDPSITAAFGAIPQGGAVGNAPLEPTAIGVPKWQTIGGRYVFKGTKYAQVIQGTDGKYYGVDPAGNVIINPDGTSAVDTPATDRSGNPVRLPAQYQAPPGPTLATRTQATSRIDPGSIAAVGGAFGPARYNEGDEVSILAGMPAEQRAQVQQQMIDRGVAPSTGVGVGGYDANWASSFKNVLAFANANNMRWDDALQAMPMVDRTTTVSKSPNQYTVNLTSPQDLSAIFKKAASDLLGGTDVPQGMIDGYVNAYQEMQRQDQMNQIADKEKASNTTVKMRVDADGNPVPTGPAVGTDSGGALPDSAATAAGPSASGNVAPIVTESALETPQQYAQDQLKNQNPGRYRATQIAQQYDVLSGMINQIGAGSGGSTQGTGP